MSTPESTVTPPSPIQADAVDYTHAERPRDAPPPAHPPATAARRSLFKKLSPWIVGAIVASFGVYLGVPVVLRAMDTVSTDDAYVNGHVTFVAPRIAGQVAQVLVDDNNRVHKGDLLVQLDKEPYQVQVNIAQAAVDAAQAAMVTADAQARGVEGKMRSLRFSLEHSIEDVDNQIALLRSRAATLQSEKATLAKAQSDFDRAAPLINSGTVSRDEYDQRKEALLVAQAKVEEALQGVYQVRVSLGLTPKPESGDDLTQVPEDLDQNFSSVKQAQASLIEAAAELGVTDTFNKSPKQMVTDFYKRDPSGDIDRIYENILKDAPSIKQSQAKLAEARRALDQANLNLRYCDIISEIDGVVTRRNVNPGNDVIAGQSLMAVRSLTEIWVDANFKETQLGSLKIGQPVDLDVDMYGRRHHFTGRITGFTYGTGSTLALLPPENATGNYVKVVQRLPVRIELTNYDPDKTPLFTGLSVTPYVLIKEKPSGPNAGQVLQPYVPMTPTSRAEAPS